MFILTFLIGLCLGLSAADNCADLCRLPICENGATCVDLGEGCFRCICAPGFTGDNCETIMLPCIPECRNGECREGTCVCHPGWAGPQCENPIDPCFPGCGNGECREGGCVCQPGWTGERCETPVDCMPGCDHGVCNEGECVCFPGWTGDKCDSPIDPGTGYTCDEEDPNYACDPTRVDLGMFRYPYEGDCNKYIECVPGRPAIQCLERQCPPDLIWDPYVTACNQQEIYYPCTTTTSHDGANTATATRQRSTAGDNKKRRKILKNKH